MIRAALKSTERKGLLSLVSERFGPTTLNRDTIPYRFRRYDAFEVDFDKEPNLYGDEDGYAVTAGECPYEKAIEPLVTVLVSENITSTHEMCGMLDKINDFALEREAERLLPYDNSIPF